MIRHCPDIFYLSLLERNQVTELYHDPSDSVEIKFRRAKKKIPANIPSKVYPTVSSAGNLYRTAKITKLDTNGKVDDLPIRPIISNIGTTTYNFAE